MNPQLRDVLAFVMGTGIIMVELSGKVPYHSEAVGFGVAMMCGVPIVYRLLDKWDRR